jgi:hypothetical protein
MVGLFTMSTLSQFWNYMRDRYTYPYFLDIGDQDHAVHRVCYCQCYHFDLVLTDYNWYSCGVDR